MVQWTISSDERRSGAYFSAARQGRRERSERQRFSHFDRHFSSRSALRAA